MGVELTIQQCGGTNSTINEVELNSKASRATMRSLDAMAHGSYCLSTSLKVASGNGTNTYFSTATNINWAGLQWVSTDNLMVIKEINASLDTDIATAGLLALQVFKVSAYQRQFDVVTVDPISSGNVYVSYAQSIAIGHGNKLRNTMLASDISGSSPADTVSVNPLSSGATITGQNAPGGNFTTLLPFTSGTFTANPVLSGLMGGSMVLETIPIGASVFSTLATPPRERVALQVLFDIESFGYPLILENSTGLVFKATFPAAPTAGNYFSSITISWDEIPAY